VTPRALRVLIALGGLGPALFASPQSQADAGLLRVSDLSDPYRISVFSEPTPLRLDRGTLSILVADAETGQPLRDVEVKVRIEPDTDPAHPFVKPAERRGRGLRFSATLDDPNALQVCPMHREFAATEPGSCPYCGMPLVSHSPAPGSWRIHVDVKSDRGEGSVSFEADVQPPEAVWISLGPSLAIPPIGILVFVLHQSLQRRMPGRRGERSRKSRRTSDR